MLVKRSFIQEYVVILELFVETILHLFYAAHDTIKIRVASCTDMSSGSFKQ